MIKYFCDCCNKEVKSLNKFEILCHLSPLYMNSISGAYADMEGNRVSGRLDQIGLCNKCYNDIVSMATTRYSVLKNEYKHK